MRLTLQMEDLLRWAELQAQSARAAATGSENPVFLRGMAEAYEITAMRIERLRGETATSDPEHLDRNDPMRHLQPIVGKYKW